VRANALARCCHIAQFGGARGHALPELGRERRETRFAQPQCPEPLKGHPDVEAQFRLLAPFSGAGDGGHVDAAPIRSGGKKRAGQGVVAHFQDQLAHEAMAVAAQDVALQIVEVDLSFYQPTPNLPGTCAAEKPG